MQLFHPVSDWWFVVTLSARIVAFLKIRPQVGFFLKMPRQQSLDGAVDTAILENLRLQERVRELAESEDVVMPEPNMSPEMNLAMHMRSNYLGGDVDDYERHDYDEVVTASMLLDNPYLGLRRMYWNRDRTIPSLVLKERRKYIGIDGDAVKNIGLEFALECLLELVVQYSEDGLGNCGEDMGKPDYKKYVKPNAEKILAAREMMKLCEWPDDVYMRVSSYDDLKDLIALSESRKKNQEIQQLVEEGKYDLRAILIYAIFGLSEEHNPSLDQCQAFARSLNYIKQKADEMYEALAALNSMDFEQESIYASLERGFNRLTRSDRMPRISNYSSYARFRQRTKGLIAESRRKRDINIKIKSFDRLCRRVEREYLPGFRETEKRFYRCVRELEQAGIPLDVIDAFLKSESNTTLRQVMPHNSPTMPLLRTLKKRLGNTYTQIADECSELIQRIGLALNCDPWRHANYAGFRQHLVNIVLKSYNAVEGDRRRLKSGDLVVTAMPQDRERYAAGFTTRILPVGVIGRLGYSDGNWTFEPIHNIWQRDELFKIKRSEIRGVEPAYPYPESLRRRITPGSCVEMSSRYGRWNMNLYWIRNHRGYITERRRKFRRTLTGIVTDTDRRHVLVRFTGKDHEPWTYDIRWKGRKLRPREAVYLKGELKKVNTPYQQRRFERNKRRIRKMLGPTLEYLDAKRQHKQRPIYRRGVSAWILLNHMGTSYLSLDVLLERSVRGS